MFFMYVVAGTVGVLLFSLCLALIKQKELKVNVISREAVADKEFFALRIETDDFLFVKDEGDVTFIQSLDDVSDYKVVDLTKKSEPEQGQLFMPNHDKKAS